ncbi:unnamed protein product [Protopolystoma xenopodis]|uniref:Uncharacterized protein n=1 Tax=Protopolystoma xenopodis TaxID=117903 RepID=A0A448XKT0_9PLAT|nr:unnamed protein product [Protopolystoma xenopodis]
MCLCQCVVATRHRKFVRLRTDTEPDTSGFPFVLLLHVKPVGVESELCRLAGQRLQPTSVMAKTELADLSVRKSAIRVGHTYSRHSQSHKAKKQSRISVIDPKSSCVSFNILTAHLCGDFISNV